jgi:hypothetical protein
MGCKLIQKILEICSSFFSIIHDYGVKRKTLKRQKKHLPIPSKANSKPKSNLVE